VGLNPPGLQPGRAAGLLASPARNLVLGLAFMAVVIALGTAAYVAAGWSLGDALYMVILTVYTVGYGETRPIDTPLLRGITIAIMMFGCTGVIYLTGALVQFITLNQINQIFGLKRMASQIDSLSDHVIICGFGRIGLQLAEELAAGGARFVILELDESRVEEARGYGHLCLAADATHEAALLAAGVLRARTLATVLPSDAANVFITLSARSLNPKLEIVARGDAPSTEGKLRQAGANTVVLLTHIGAERIAELILYPETARLIRGSDRMRDFDKTLNQLGLEMEVVTAAAGSPAVGLTMAALEQRGEGAFYVVQVNRQGAAPVTRPLPGMLVQPGDGLVLIGRSPGMRGLFEPPGHPLDGRYDGA
jgi:voltage-gated potassium channel Kch